MNAQLIPNHTEIKPEFARVKDIQKMFGLKRGTLYFLLKKGSIRGHLIRGQGNIRGVRIIDVESVRQFIKDSPQN